MGWLVRLGSAPSLGLPLSHMKRRAFNSTLPAPTKEMKRTGWIERSRTPLKQTRHRKAYQHLRDPDFKAWVVREKPCLLAGRKGHVCKGRVEFAHLDNEGNGGCDRGNGVPLCGLAGHREGSKSWHVLGKDSWPAYWGINPYAVALELAAEYEDEMGAGFA